MLLPLCRQVGVEQGAHRLQKVRGACKQVGVTPASGAVHDINIQQRVKLNLLGGWVGGSSNDTHQAHNNTTRVWCAVTTSGSARG